MARKMQTPSQTSAPFVGYARVSTSEQGESGLSLTFQRQQIDAHAATQALDLVHVEEIGSGASVEKRPQLQAVLDALANGEYAGLVVSKLDRLSRSTLDFATLVATAERQGWSLVVLDLGLDLSTAMGRFVASILSSVAELERNLISDRTKAGMSIAKQQGKHCGRTSSAAPGLVARVVRERQAGSTLRAIAEGLTAESIPTPGGSSRWSTANVSQLLKTAPARALIEAA